MSAPEALIVPPGERGKLRLFALSLGEVGLKALREPGEIDPLPGLLGVDALNRDQLDIIAIGDLGEMPLSQYLALGGGIPEAALAPDRAVLDALTGHVLALRSAAFSDAGATLRPGPEMRFVGCYGEERVEVRHAPLPSEAAGAYSGTAAPERPPSEPAVRHRMGSLLVLGALLFFALFLWVLA